MPRTAAPGPGFPCRLCGSSDLHLFYTQGNRDQYRFYRCAGCLLVNYDLAGGLNQGKYARSRVSPRASASPRSRRIWASPRSSRASS